MQVSPTKCNLVRQLYINHLILGWMDFFEKCEFQIAWGVKSSVLVPRCHRPNIIEFFWRPLHFCPEEFKNRMGMAKNLQNGVILVSFYENKHFFLFSTCHLDEDVKSRKFCEKS
jgi:hypothetical protein